MGLGDQAEELTLEPRQLSMRGVERPDQLVVFVFLVWGHPDLAGSRGRRLGSISNMCSNVKASSEEVVS
jgi:hypothetical protein